MTTLLTGNKVGHIGSLTSVGAVLVALLVLSGCGGFSYNYSKPGVSQQQHAQDHFECKQISRQSYIVGTGGTLVGGSAPTWDVLKECLEARGYTVTVKSEDKPKSKSNDAAQSCDRYARASSTSPYSVEYAHCMEILGK
jgi:hypothetical protein